MYLRLEKGKNTSVARRQIPSQREQYGSTVHLFIGTERSPCKITPMSFTFANNSISIRRGLNSLFIFKSVSFSVIMLKLFCAQLQLCAILHTPFVLLHTVALTQVRRYLFMHYTFRNIVKSCFWGPSEAEGPQQWDMRLWTFEHGTSRLYVSSYSCMGTVHLFIGTIRYIIACEITIITSSFIHITNCLEWLGGHGQSMNSSIVF
jgi:hypothetical protein